MVRKPEKYNGILIKMAILNRPLRVHVGKDVDRESVYTVGGSVN